MAGKQPFVPIFTNVLAFVEPKFAKLVIIPVSVIPIGVITLVVFTKLVFILVISIIVFIAIISELNTITITFKHLATVLIMPMFKANPA